MTEHKLKMAMLDGLADQWFAGTEYPLLNWPEPIARAVKFAYAEGLYAGRTSHALEWRHPKDAPYGEVLIAWGGGGLRFMYRDDVGQWRNMLRAPRPEPKCWRFPPEQPTADQLHALKIEVAA